jgi:hypothetical protein
VIAPATAAGSSAIGTCPHPGRPRALGARDGSREPRRREEAEHRVQLPEQTRTGTSTALRPVAGCAPTVQRSVAWTPAAETRQGRARIGPSSAARVAGLAASAPHRQVDRHRVVARL